MSEYQYYEFLAVDRPLDATAQAELRAVSSRARITAAGFVNHYEWGDLKADPRRLLERYFDLFLYLANWGTRRFAIRLPAHLIDARSFARFCPQDDGPAQIARAGEHAVIDICRDEIDQDDWDDGGSCIWQLAPLRDDIIRGDLRALYLVWLMAVEDGFVDDAAPEPLAGIAPLSAALRAFADFFAIDPDLVDVATSLGRPPLSPEAERAAAEAYIRSLPDNEKVALLLRLHDGQPHLGAELRRRRLAAAQTPDAGCGQRTAGDLREAARRLAAARERLAAEKAAAERRRREAELKRERDRHLARLAERGEAAWRDVDELISRRNQPAYERATALLADLGEVARARGDDQGFARRVAEIRTRHDRKGRLIERLDAAGLP